MKIALFTETYLPYINGVVTHVKILKEGLEKLGHKVLVVTADPHTHRYYVKDSVLHCPAKSFKRFYDSYGLAVSGQHKTSYVPLRNSILILFILIMNSALDFPAP